MKKKYIIGFVIVALFCPIVINLIMRWIGSDDAWVGFWGSYLGSLLSVGTAFVVLYEQRKDNHVENENNRIANEQENERNRTLHLKEIQYRQNMAWLGEFRKAVLDNLSIYMPGNICSLISRILQDDFTEQDVAFIQDKTSELFVQIVQTDTVVGMIVLDNLSENILKYNGIRISFCDSICGKIKDIQIISTIKKCLIHKERYNKKRVIESCTSQELRGIFEEGDQDFNQYELYIKLEEFLKKMINELYQSFNQFRKDSIDCINVEYRRFSQGLVSNNE